LPADAVEIKPTNNDFHIIADSETTGNHHVVEMTPRTKIYQSNGRTFIKNAQKTKVRCVHPNRHDAITLEPNLWEVDRQQEYDHFEQNLRAVRD
jgi:cell division protein FtsI/penicillin-binding protein 2